MKKRLSCLTGIGLLGAAALLLYALDAFEWESAPRPHAAFATVTIPQRLTAPVLVQPVGERAVVVSPAFEADAGASTATRIDLTRGTAAAVLLDSPFDRTRFTPLVPLPLGGGPVSSSFRGVDVPLPQLSLFSYDGKRWVSFDHRLTGVETLLLGRTPLLTRYLVNGRGLERSHRSETSAYQSTDGSTLLLLHGTRSGTTVWLFHDNEATSREKR